MTEGIEQVTRINPTKGNYAIQFPEGTDEKMKDQWAEMYNVAKKEGRPIILEPGVKVIDLDAVAKVDIATKPAEPVKVEAPVVQEQPAPAPVEAPQPVPVPQPVAQPQVQQLPPGYIPQDQIQFYQPQYQVVQGQPMQYNPFYAQTGPGMQPVVQQPVNPQQVVYYPGVAPQYGYVPVPQGQAQPVQRVYNPQLAEGPIGQHSAPVPQAQQPARVGGPFATLQHPSYSQQQGVQGQPPQQ